MGFLGVAFLALLNYGAIGMTVPAIAHPWKAELEKWNKAPFTEFDVNMAIILWPLALMLFLFVGVPEMVLKRMTRGW